MALGAIDLTSISRAQDYSPIKQNEDNKAFMDQNNIGQNVRKDIQQRAREVRTGDNSDWHSRKFDAKDKGSNEYQGDGGRRKNGNNQKEQMIVKGGHQGFDIKI